MCKALLLNKQSVKFRSSGNSLWPRVWSGDCCMYEPIEDHNRLAVGDIVFCQVQEGDRYFAHKILRIGEYQLSEAESYQFGVVYKRVFIIGNQSGWENGWCFDEHIYGLLVAVVG